MTQQMARQTFLHESFETHSDKTAPADIRSIGIADLKDALRRGYDDFKAMPSHAVFLCVIYPVIGVLLGGLTLGYSLSWMLFPIIAGFALVGPLAAVGLYELSRRREAGLDTTSTHALDVLRSDRASAILALGIMQLVIYGAWLAAAQAIYYGSFGDMSALSLGEFLRQVFTTQQGWMLILVGNVVGFFFAVVVLFISAFSFPMVVDRHVGAGLAAELSMRAVWHNLGPMIAWGIIVAVLLAIGVVLALAGLAVVMPILGHATWHLYRKVIVR
jgi:uncharacterized membrane protein